MWVLISIIFTSCAPKLIPTNTGALVQVPGEFKRDSPPIWTGGTDSMNKIHGPGKIIFPPGQGHPTQIGVGEAEHGLTHNMTFNKTRRDLGFFNFMHEVADIEADGLLQGAVALGGAAAIADAGGSSSQVGDFASGVLNNDYAQASRSAAPSSSITSQATQASKYSQARSNETIANNGAGSSRIKPDALESSSSLDSKKKVVPREPNGLTITWQTKSGKWRADGANQYIITSYDSEAKALALASGPGKTRLVRRINIQTRKDGVRLCGVYEINKPVYNKWVASSWKRNIRFRYPELKNY